MNDEIVDINLIKLVTCKYGSNNLGTMCVDSVLVYAIDKIVSDAKCRSANEWKILIKSVL